MSVAAREGFDDPWPPPLGAGRLILLAAALLAVAAALGSGASTAPRRPPPSVLLVTLDTTRADHCSAYGYERPTTPRLDALLPTSVRFELAYAPMATTLPSHATMFTALYPRSHGALKNGHVLADGAVTLAEALGGAGYRTAAFVSSFVLHRKFGPHQGFHTYDDAFGDEPCKMLGKKWEGRELETSFCRRGADTRERAVAWLAESGYLDGARPGARARAFPPFFVWVHLFDPHNPYLPPAEHAVLFPPRGADPTPLEREVAAYDGEIHYADEQLGLLLDRLAEAGILDRTLLVVAGDHGEGLLQHGWMNHGVMIYEEAVRVPLLFRWPARLAGGRTVAGPVELVDLAPTVLELADVPAALPASEGRSLEGVLTGAEQADPGRAVFLQRREYATQVLRGVRLEGEKHGVRLGRWKYIEAKQEGTRELYDLESDPHETRNLVGARPEEAARLAGVLAAWVSASPAGAAAARRGRKVAPEDAERLRALGYVQ